MGVSARIGANAATGLLQPKVGEPNDLLLQYLPANYRPNPGEYVVTSGTVSNRRIAVPAGHPDRTGRLGQRRKRV